MLKNRTILEIKVNERAYQLECAPESPLGELYDALSQMRGYVLQRMVDENEKAKPKEPVEPVEIE